MPRTTPALVRGIVEVDDDTWPSLSPFIEAANELVTEKCTASGYDDSRLRRIETWLAAHFYCCVDKRARQEQTGKVFETFESYVGNGLDLTAYGQQVKIFDTAGNLAALDNSLDKVTTTLPGGGKVVKTQWLGKKRCP